MSDSTDFIIPGACSNWPRGSDNGPGKLATVAVADGVLRELDVAGMIRDGVPPVKYDIENFIVTRNAKRFYFFF